MSELRRYDFWFALEDQPDKKCWVQLAAADWTTAVSRGALEAYQWLSKQHPGVKASHVRLVLGTAEPFHANII